MTPAFADRRLRSVELLQHGQRALREGRRAEARRCFQEAVTTNPLEGRAWLELARLSSPVARAFYLVEAFDLNPTNRSTLEELRHAYRDVLRLTTGAAPAAPQAVDRAPVETLAAAPPPASVAEEKAAGLPSPSLLQVTHWLISQPDIAGVWEELRRAYRDMLRLTTGAASAAPQPVDRAPVETLAAAPPPASVAEEKAAGLPSPSLLQVTHRLISQLDIAGVLEELRRAGREVSSAFSALARQLIRRVQTEPPFFFPRQSNAAPPLRLYILLGVGLWFVAALLGVSLLTTLSIASDWQRPAPAAIALGSLRKAMFTPTATPLPTVITATPIPSATPTAAWRVLEMRWQVITATPIPSATPTDTPEPLLRWAPELEANGWTFERGACEAPFDGPVGTETFMWPANNHYLSGHNFSWRYHPGIDIATQLGDPIYASDTGVVVFAGWNSQGYGDLVVLDHGNGWETLYAHLSQFNVDCGQAVYQGDVVGYAGSTGNSTGPHLHFEILNDTSGRVNPWSYLP